MLTFEKCKDLQHEFIKNLLDEGVASGSGIPALTTCQHRGELRDPYTPRAWPSHPPNTFVKEFVTITPKRIIWLKIIQLKITEIVANKISFNY